jgi:hypothetical protein
MANLAIVGSHSTNGVAAIHSELLRNDGQGPGRAVPRTLQQQDQRRHARGAGCCWQPGSPDDHGAIGTVDQDLGELAEAQAARRDRGFVTLPRKRNTPSASPSG